MGWMRFYPGGDPVRAGAEQLRRDAIQYLSGFAAAAITG
jgi:hypothetical protein